MTINYLPIFSDSPTNAARVYVPTGDIEINLSRWRELTDAEREFVLRHEEGHFARQTFDECEADDYALKQMALKKPYSLQNHIKAVENISKNNAERVQNATRKTLLIAAKNGSKEAQKILGLANAEGTPKAKNYTFLVIFALVGTLFITIKTFNKR